MHARLVLRDPGAVRGDEDGGLVDRHERGVGVADSWPQSSASMSEFVTSKGFSEQAEAQWPVCEGSGARVTGSVARGLLARARRTASRTARSRSSGRIELVPANPQQPSTSTRIPTPLVRESPADSSWRSAVATYRTRVCIIRASTCEAPSLSAVWMEASSGWTRLGLSNLTESSVMRGCPSSLFVGHGSCFVGHSVWSA